MSDTRDKIMDLAEGYLRGGGYGAFSFRQIGENLGIKSASVHYHFPTKNELCSAVIERYRRRFLVNLGDANEEGAVWNFVDAFCSALKSDGKICLCGVLAGESGGLVAPIRDEVNRFSVDCLAWLTIAIERSTNGTDQNPDTLAQALFFALEGAMAFAVVSGDHATLRRVAETILTSWGIRE